MATDSTELTFVRCPSCRSLVPAVSQRCRMCGATLDASQKVEEDKDQKRSSRVRQRTLSSPTSELAAAAGLLRQELSGEPGDVTATQQAPDSAAKPAAKAAEPTPEIEFDDPLSAYIEEVEVAEASRTSGNGATTAPATPPAAEKPMVTAAPHKPIAPEKPIATAGNERVADSAAVEKPKVIVESGPRKANKPSNLSFGRGAEEKPAARTETQAAPETPRRLEPEVNNKPVREENEWSPVQRDRRPERNDRPERLDRQERRATEDGSMRNDQPRNNEQARQEQQRHDQSRQAARPHQPPRGESPARVEPPRAQPAPRQDENRPARRQQEQQGRSDEIQFSPQNAGRLCGWLVSFKDPRGTAIELREGRFFVTASSLKPNDLVLDDESVSTPHALLAVALNEGMRLQDLMSERGVWVRRRGQEGYQRIGEAARLEHGDWVRFGEVEFLVSFLSAPGMK